MPVLKLTKSKVEELPFTEDGQIVYYDEDLKGFGVVIGAQSKTYFAQHTVNRRKVRCTIGRHGAFTTEEARKEARLLLLDMYRGHDPNQLKKEKRLQGITFEQAFADFLKNKVNLSAASVADYKRVVDKHLSDWKTKPLEHITKEMVSNRNAHIHKNSGGTIATKAMRVFSSVYNHTRVLCEKLPENPVVILSRRKQWFKSERRHSVIKPHQLKPWYESVQAQANGTVRDYLLLLLFTGMRKSEGLSLTWDCVDFAEGTLTIQKTKNGRPLILPLSDFTQKLLKDRYATRSCKQFVFPGYGKRGHLEEPKKVIRKIIKETGIKFMLHDLRRTFITTAESMDISAYALKYMMNHKTGNDLTGGYIILDVNRIREPMQRVSSKLLALITSSQFEIA